MGTVPVQQRDIPQPIFIECTLYRTMPLKRDPKRMINDEDEMALRSIDAEDKQVRKAKSKQCTQRDCEQEDNGEEQANDEHFAQIPSDTRFQIKKNIKKPQEQQSEERKPEPSRNKERTIRHEWSDESPFCSDNRLSDCLSPDSKGLTSRFERIRPYEMDHGKFRGAEVEQDKGWYYPTRQWPMNRSDSVTIFNNQLPVAVVRWKHVDLVGDGHSPAYTPMQYTARIRPFSEYQLHCRDDCIFKAHTVGYYRPKVIISWCEPNRYGLRVRSSEYGFISGVLVYEDVLFPSCASEICVVVANMTNRDVSFRGGESFILMDTVPLD